MANEQRNKHQSWWTKNKGKREKPRLNLVTVRLIPACPPSRNMLQTDGYAPKPKISRRRHGASLSNTLTKCCPVHRDNNWLFLISHFPALAYYCSFQDHRHGNGEVKGSWEGRGWMNELIKCPIEHNKPLLPPSPRSRHIWPISTHTQYVCMWCSNNVLCIVYDLADHRPDCSLVRLFALRPCSLICPSVGPSRSICGGWPLGPAEFLEYNVAYYPPPKKKFKKKEKKNSQTGAHGTYVIIIDGLCLAWCLDPCSELVFQHIGALIQHSTSEYL